jgi:glycosyltransferase involved in cell wall biosynthesis
VICTVRNEIATIGHLVESLLAGTRRPDEIVISDAGSTDGTREALREIAARSGRVSVVDAPGNRSRGRNAAIDHATHPLIASIDGGCIPEPDWLENLIEPFGRGAQWVGGFYRPGGSHTRQVCIGLTMVFVLEEARAGGFFPSARSMAFTREAWKAVGGFPESLEVSEDTAFDEALERAGYEMVFQPDAVVAWTPPATLRGLGSVLWEWSRSDGVAGIRSFAYLSMLRFAAISVALAVAAAFVDPWLAVVGVVPFLGLAVRQTRYKYRWARGASKYLWIPLAWLVGFVARLGGFLTGRRQRRRAARSPQDREH